MSDLRIEPFISSPSAATYANATNVEIVLQAKPAEVELKVSDNGKGITEEEISDPKSFGLMGIMERVHSLGGVAEIGGTKNEGTTVKVIIPNDWNEESTVAQYSSSR